MDNVIAEPATAFSPDALREKYRLEREKRLRDDASEQYREFTSLYAEDDPYTPRAERAPSHEEIDVAIIGGGFGGMLAGVRLRQAGRGNFRIIEKGGDIGGTWYWNRYPGARCDVESYIYLPLLEDTGYVTTERYTTAAEIFAYCQSLGRKYDLYSNALFHTTVEHLAWDETARRWLVHTSRGDRLSARFVVIAGGVLHKPKLPGIPGIETFQGHSFHTCRWDYDYTGGDATGGLDKLADKRVGIIGTGATAVQAIPLLAASAGQLFVFQRTPSGVGPRGNGPTDREWFTAQEPGWQRRRVENFTVVTAGSGYTGKAIVQDGWTDVFLPLAQAAAGDPDHAEQQRELADFKNMERVRGRIDEIVKDPATAEALKPYYNQMCKRPCFHDEYLEAFNRPNVTLVDTNGQGIERITPAGAVVAGVEYKLDCLIYASGFEVASKYTKRLGFDIKGRGGLSMTECLDDGIATLFGMHVRDFPNLLVFSTTQCAASVNYVHVLDELSQHAAYVVDRALAIGAETVEPSEQAAEAWFNVILGRIGGIGDFHKTCTPGYYNNEGSTKGGVLRNMNFNGDANEYFGIIRNWREEGGLKGLEIEGASGPIEAAG